MHRIASLIVLYLYEAFEPFLSLQVVVRTVTMFDHRFQPSVIFEIVIGSLVFVQLIQMLYVGTMAAIRNSFHSLRPLPVIGHVGYLCSPYLIPAAFVSGCYPAGISMSSLRCFST
jgi:hypothetical protein